MGVLEALCSVSNLRAELDELYYITQKYGISARINN